MLDISPKMADKGRKTWEVYYKLHIIVPNCRKVDTRLTLTPSAIPNSNYVIMVSD
jgi:hypothetical protein